MIFWIQSLTPREAVLVLIEEGHYFLMQLTFFALSFLLRGHCVVVLKGFVQLLCVQISHNSLLLCCHSGCMLPTALSEEQLEGVMNAQAWVQSEEQLRAERGLQKLPPVKVVVVMAQDTKRGVEVVIARLY